MTDLETGARRIRDAFERDLAAYHAPPDLTERAHRGGQRRIRRRRIQALAGLAAVVAAVALAVTMLPSGGRTSTARLAAWTVTRGTGAHRPGGGPPAAERFKIHARVWRPGENIDFRSHSSFALVIAATGPAGHGTIAAN